MSKSENQETNGTQKRSSYSYSLKLTLRDEKYQQLKNAAESMSMKQRELVQMIIDQLFERADESTIETWISIAETRILIQQAKDRAAAREKEVLMAQARERDADAHLAKLLERLTAQEDEAQTA
jgi:leucyl aminopeptidase (aminopeptidase T)